MASDERAKVHRHLKLRQARQLSLHQLLIDIPVAVAEHHDERGIREHGTEALDVEIGRDEAAPKHQTTRFGGW